MSAVHFDVCADGIQQVSSASVVFQVLCKLRLAVARKACCCLFDISASVAERPQAV